MLCINIEIARNDSQSEDDQLRSESGNSSKSYDQIEQDATLGVGIVLQNEKEVIS